MDISLNELRDYNNFKQCLPDNFQTKIISNPTWVKVDDIKYNENMFISIATSNNVEQFGKIVYILATKEEVIFLFRKAITMGFEEHYHAFKIIETQEWGFVAQQNLLKEKPKTVHTNANGHSYVIC